ncbi:hypothetical protein [Alicyclobacillus macrosporangiidus]|uniref:hypothetical protein n=1 Tax=Alicyclobacillus macrosporangiidus TaxID=392015 RepID=UPI00049847BA|nr:hypothetical protein [Alicyclobacillus macrosporangiidus]
MLEVHSPIPLTEGENIVFGIRTKHVFHFLIGVGVSTPIMVLLLFVLPLVHEPKFVALFIGAGVGLLFALMPVSDRPLAEWLWLTIRYARRPKVVLYDREYRIRVHRRRAEERWAKKP